MDLVDVSKDAPVLRLDASHDVDSSVELLLLIAVCKRLDACNEVSGLPLRDGTAGFDCIDHEHEPAEREVGMCQSVARRMRAIGLDCDIEIAECLDVAIDALALCLYAIRLELLDELCHRESMLGVGLLLEDLPEIEDLELLVSGLGHVSSFAVRTP